MATFEEVTVCRGLDDVEVWGGGWEVGKLPDRKNSRCKGPKEETHLQPHPGCWSGKQGGKLREKVR